ncbi:Fic family protein [Roseivirga sp.]|uniref:Fic family protein n=1 Tax=Roseivirga sp. TaxID=1964215 RepID=UPI003B8CCD2B
MGQKTPYISLPIAQSNYETIPVLKADSLANQALGELKGIAKTIPNQLMLVNAIVLQEAKDSSEIENIITTQDELYKAMSANIQSSPAVKEVVNYRKAIFHGFNLIESKQTLDLNDLLSIQETIVTDKPGIRNSPGTVLVNDKTGETVYTPPQEKVLILELLHNFLENFNTINKNIPPLVNLAILHHQFESIHPFYDGNGRTGRILNILFLSKNGLLDLPILYLSSFIIEHKSNYYKLLDEVNTTGKWEEWILYMLRAIEETSKKTIAKIDLINNELKKAIDLAREKMPKSFKKELIELLFEQPYCKIEYVVKRLEVERKAASRYLKELETIKLLSSQKVGREMIYKNIGLIEILKKR